MTPRCLLGLFLTAVATASAASIPYQGILTDDKGVPVPDGDKAVTFAVYGQSAGGTALWSEARTVTTRKGLFSLSLGTVSSLPDALFARDSLFLNVTVAGKDLLPRTSLGASPWAFHARKADTAQFARSVAGLDGKANVTELANYAPLTSLAAYAKTEALSGYATTAALNSVAKSVGAKLDSNQVVRYNAYGDVKLADTSSIQFPRDNSGWGTELGATGLHFYSGGDNGTFTLMKSPATFGVALHASNRGGTYDIFTTDGRDVNFSGDVAIAGNLTSPTITKLAADVAGKLDSTRLVRFNAYGDVKLADTNSFQFPRDDAGWGTELSATGLHFYSGGDNGSFSLVKSAENYGVALHVSNRGGAYDIFNTDGHDVNFSGNMAIAGGVKLPATSTIQFDRNAESGWGTEVSTDGLHIYSGGDNGSFSLIKSADTYGVALHVSNRGGAYDILKTDGHNVDFSGNVVIAGSLKAKATVVVPDYVFEPDYKLAPLAEVESYIVANKHLPEIPSAKEIEAGGVDLAQMNLLLLKKVEELTLHAIAQEKRIQALEDRLK